MGGKFKLDILSQRSEGVGLTQSAKRIFDDCHIQRIASWLVH